MQPTDDYYKSVLLKKPSADDGPGDSMNYKMTADPNVVIGKYGVRISKDDMEKFNKDGMKWSNFPEFANWLGGWAHNPVDYDAEPQYYRTYPNGNLAGSDIAVLRAKGDPKINAILGRNIAKPGEVPMFGPEDSDMLKQLIANHKNPAVDYMALVKSK
jgi:hypothetical protein